MTKNINKQMKSFFEQVEVLEDKINPFHDEEKGKIRPGPIQDWEYFQQTLDFAEKVGDFYPKAMIELERSIDEAKSYDHKPKEILQAYQCTLKYYVLMVRQTTLLIDLAKRNDFDLSKEMIFGKKPQIGGNPL